MQIDLKYLCTVIGNLAGVPIRLYKEGKQSFYYSLVRLPVDPVVLYEQELLAKTDSVGYFITPRFNYYGTVRCEKENVQIIIGPTRQLSQSEQTLKDIAFDCNVKASDVDDFVMSMTNIVPLPLNTVLQVLFTINHVLNGETLNLEDVSIYAEKQEDIIKTLNKKELDKLESNTSNNSFALEQTLMNIVRHGDTVALKEWVSSAPAVKSGIIAHEQLRQSKNTFIVTSTLVCRNAIRGGMDVHEALALSDLYIQSCELMSSLSEINNLQYRMVVDYTERVERIRRGKTPTTLSLAVANYVYNHLSDVIKTEDIAKELFFSRSRLATKFKQETGITLTDYIMTEKTNEAKRLLRYSDKTLSQVSEYLGFSSQSHFSRVFKKYVGLTPKQYVSEN